MAKKMRKRILEQDCIGGIALKRTHMDQQKDSRDAENLFKPCIERWTSNSNAVKSVKSVSNFGS